MKRRQFLTSTVAAGVSASIAARQLWAEEGQKASAVQAVRADGGRVALTAAELEELRGLLHGRLLLLANPGYDDARRVFNPAIDKHPALIVQPLDAADVRLAVNFVREHGLLLAVKCGGHSYSGQSTCEGGVLVDLTRMRGVRVDPVRRRAWVEGGSFLGLVDHEALSHGLVVPLGTYAATGVGGLTTGGGFGRVARRWGLTLDHVRAVDVVTADGRLVHADDRSNADLLWAVSGGGGNFGVVTNFEFELHPMQSRVVAGIVSFPFSEARSIFQAYGDYSQAGPDELYMDAFLSGPTDSSEGAISINVCYSGDERSADRVLQSIRRFGAVRSDSLKGMTYLQAQGANAQTDGRFSQIQLMSTRGMYMKTGFVTGISADLIQVMVDSLSERHPKRSRGVFFQHAGGAINRVPASATAFPHRQATHLLLSSTSWALGEDGDEHIRDARQHWRALEPFTRGYYTNDMTGEEGASSIDENYRGNFPRLVQIKRKYDPGNLFRLNANIKP